MNFFNSTSASRSGRGGKGGGKKGTQQNRKQNKQKRNRLLARTVENFAFSSLLMCKLCVSQTKTVLIFMATEMQKKRQK